jgi:hypothetical protein
VLETIHGRGRIRSDSIEESAQDSPRLRAEHPTELAIVDASRRCGTRPTLERAIRRAGM